MATDPLSQAAGNLDKATETLARVGELIVYGGAGGQGGGRSGSPASPGGGQGGTLALANVRATTMFGSGAIVNIARMQVTTAGDSLMPRGPQVRVTGATWNTNAPGPTSTGVGGVGGGLGGVGGPQPSGGAGPPQGPGQRIPVVRVVGATWNAGTPGGGGGGVGGGGGAAQQGVSGQPSSQQGSSLARFADGIALTAIRLRGFASALQAAANVALGFAGKASPQHVATFQGSLDMVSARLGKVFLPLLDRLSLQAQKTADALDTDFGKGAIKHAGRVLGMAPDALTGGEAGAGGLVGITMMMAKLPMWINQGWKAATGGGGLGEKMDRDWTEMNPDLKRWMKWVIGEDQKPLKRSMAGMPQPQEMDAEQFRMQMFMSALTMGRDTPEADVQRNQWQEMIGLMTQVAANTRPKESAIPAFR